MKRSEAIEIIDEVLYKYKLPLLLEISKEILGRLEKVGMLPPKYEISLIEQHEGFGGSSSMTIFEWEPEDEKK